VSPPITPGIPGTRLPDPWEAPLKALERRVERLEQNDTTMRAQLQSYSDEEEDSQVTIPTDAPPRAKVALAVLGGLPPAWRAVVVLAVIGAVVFLVLRGVRLIP
jgi:anti-sigma factor RsiW